MYANIAKIASVFGLYGQVCANEEAIVLSTDSFVQRDKGPASVIKKLPYFYLLLSGLDKMLLPRRLMVRKYPRLASQDIHALDNRVASRFVRALALHFLLPDRQLF